ncbi:hypothetical protein RugamoR64_44170 [Duganella rhizosphaerae]
MAISAAKQIHQQGMAASDMNYALVLAALRGGHVSKKEGEEIQMLLDQEK